MKLCDFVNESNKNLGEIDIFSSDFYTKLVWGQYKESKHIILFKSLYWNKYIQKFNTRSKNEISAKAHKFQKILDSISHNNTPFCVKIWKVIHKCHLTVFFDKAKNVFLISCTDLGTPIETFIVHMLLLKNAQFLPSDYKTRLKLSTHD